MLILCDFYQNRDIDLLQIRYVTTLRTSLHTSFKLRKLQLCSQNLPYKILHTHIYVYAAAAAKSLQSCPTLCDPIDSSPSGSPVPEILQARTLQWVAIFFSNAWKWKVKVKSLSCFRLLATPWTADYQAPPPMGFSRQAYWSGSPLPYSMLNGKEMQKRGLSVCTYSWFFLLYSKQKLAQRCKATIL